MGYDMHLSSGPTEAEEQAVNEARTIVDAALAKRAGLQRGTPEWEAAQDEVMEAFDVQDGHRKSYFRLNISGMGYCMDLMAQYGMMFSARYQGDWPTYPEIPDDATGEQEDELHAEYNEAAKPFLSQHPGDEPGIPSFKFGSNDGWIITEQECRQAVDAWKVLGSPAPTYEDKPLRWWAGWIEFLENGATRGGIIVR